jgi:hypothetical protein
MAESPNRRPCGEHTAKSFEDMYINIVFCLQERKSSQTFKGHDPLVTVTVLIATVFVTVTVPLMVAEDTTGFLDEDTIAFRDEDTTGFTTTATLDGAAAADEIFGAATEDIAGLIDDATAAAAADDATTGLADDATGATTEPSSPAFWQVAPEHALYSDSAREPPQNSLALPLHFMLQLPKIPATGARSAGSVLPQ